MHRYNDHAGWPISTDFDIRGRLSRGMGIRIKHSLSNRLHLPCHQRFRNNWARSPDFCICHLEVFRMAGRHILPCSLHARQARGEAIVSVSIDMSRTYEYGRMSGFGSHGEEVEGQILKMVENLVEELEEAE